MAGLKPILVTGSHRSGSTWVGRMVATAPSTWYIHEPFNVVQYNPLVCKARFQYWFTYITEENEGLYLRDLRDTVELRYDLIAAVRANPRPRNIKHRTREYLEYARLRRAHTRPIVKDPIALLSAEWLSGRLGMEPVVIIRHPAAFVASVKAQNWVSRFDHLLEQPLLMRDHLAPFESEMRDFVRHERDVVDQAALLWKLLYHVVLKFRARHPDWIYVRHADLSRHPIEGFAALFERLGLTFDERSRQAIELHSQLGDDGPAAPGTIDPNLQRDSERNIRTWKERLTPAEISRVRSTVEDVAHEFYADNEW